MPWIFEEQMPFIKTLREGPTAALEHIRALYHARAPGPIYQPANSELTRCASNLFAHFAMPSGSPDADIIARSLGPEIRRACFENEILLLFADMLADPDFLIHFSGFTLCITRCTLVLIRAWLLEIQDHPATSDTALVSPHSAQLFFDKIELACLTFWEDRFRIINAHGKDTGFILFELQGVLYTAHVIRSSMFDNIIVSPGMLKATVLFWVHSHTIVDDSCTEEQHFDRIYSQTREGTVSLLLDTLFEGRQRWAGAPRDESDLTVPPEHEDTLAEIIQNLGPGRLLRAMLNALKYSRFMGGEFRRLRDCLVACHCLYQAGDASFKEVYLQMPMLQGLSSSSAVLRQDTPAPLHARDLVEEQRALEAYRSVWIHMSIIGSACRSGSISPSLIDSISVWRMMLESVTVALELSMEIYSSQEDPVVVEYIPYLQSFQDALLRSLSIWTDGIQDSRTGRGGFPKSVVEGLVGDEIKGALMWYDFIRTTRGKFPGRVDIPAVVELLDGWLAFGRALGFEESTERDRRPVARTCSWRDCAHFTSPASKPLMVCKGCKESRYCSTACQRSDWKQGGHRVKCRRLKT